MMRGNPLPPRYLRKRVSGRDDGRNFIDVGRICYRDICAALPRPLVTFHSILDFGCGSGRTLRHFSTKGARIYGTDTDADAIAWCQKAYPYADCRVNDHLPPLPYPDGAFDLIYMISVFTHLDAARQLAWLPELRRILAPGGVFIATVHGGSLQGAMSEKTRAEYESVGYAFRAAPSSQTDFPSWYGCAWHTEQYIRTTWAPWFTLRDYIPQGLNTHQDLARFD